ncbi:hypothetical protein KIH74_02660 [Kineosporia sp. J2-2]|uniref:GH26 domain-containing protein n=1 Tax=Kineosporia corallincola TaxID=2835133 RepID=A0ABS5T9R2_9ACTN|nr:glycosyl hydrolase [Kineosporia corallincola]MBT0767809.1 hypothetical protein [Kineosporia corallincola]
MRATPPDDERRPGPSGTGRHAAPAADAGTGQSPSAQTNPLPSGDGARWTQQREPQDARTEGAEQPPGTGAGTPPAPPGGPNKKLLGAGAAVVVLLLVAVIFAVSRGSDDGDGTATPTTSASATATASDGTEYGVFRQTSADDVASFEEWLGADVSYVVDFSARATWDNIANPDYLLEEWQNTPYRLVYAVPMLPDDDTGASVKSGANGDYDAYFRTLAQNLVKYGQSDAVLRVGWEFNLTDWAWSTDDSDSWKSYYRSIVEAMRSVDGANFTFDWNVNNGSNTYDAVDYYPGDDVVDYVGVDAYDVSGVAYPYPDDCDSACYVKHQKQAWDESIYGGDRGLEFWSGFAQEHDKQLSIPEWGCWARTDGIGGHDDPDYIQRMYDFITDPDNNVAYAAYFEYDYSDGEGGQHSLEQSFPNSGTLFKKLFQSLYATSSAA